MCNRWHRQHLPALTGKQIVVIVGRHHPLVTPQIMPDRLDRWPVQGNHAVLVRLGLFEINGVTDLNTPHLTHSDRQQLICPVGGIDAKRKQAEVTRLVAQTTLDDINSFFGADRFYFGL